MGRLPFPALVEAGIVSDALADRRCVKVVEGLGQRRHISLAVAVLATGFAPGAGVGLGFGVVYARYVPGIGPSLTGPRVMVGSLALSLGWGFFK